jgi:superfamily II DNA or RNA helicase
VSGADALLGRLARAALRSRGLYDERAPITLGRITLFAHQVAAIRWLNARIATYGGALLADPPGLGKTFIALGVASSRATRPLVIAPASLRKRWSDASKDTGVALDFVSTERLSAPRALSLSPHALVIIDEAHHLRTIGTRRHRRTAELCTNAQVLLLSATPIHNHGDDLQHIVRLFHLPLTRRSVTFVRRFLTLRRTLSQIAGMEPSALASLGIPVIARRAPIIVSTRESPLPAAVMTLPSLRAENDDGHLLFQLGLLHALRSSDAAVERRIRRRIASTLAVEQAALANVAATPAFRRAWRSDMDAVQLAMPHLLGEALTGPREPESADRARAQRSALEALLTHVRGDGSDLKRARVLRRLARWCSAPVVAFTQFEATARALHHHLRQQPGIALLSGTTARIASGAISREEVLDRLLLARFQSPRDAIRLLITTDVLSEGLSLAGVGTIVHLDLPWTPARLDQRVGRAARIGAPVPCVRTVLLPAPLQPAAQEFMRSLLARKRRAMRDVECVRTDDDATVAVQREMVVRGAQQTDYPRWVTLVSADIATARTLAIVAVGARRLLVVLDTGALRRPTLDDWNAFANSSTSVATSTRAGSIGALRLALHDHQATLELTQMVSDPRDLRLRARRDYDAILSAAPRHHRARMIDDAFHAKPRQTSAALHTREIRIIAGVELVSAIAELG